MTIKCGICNEEIVVGDDVQDGQHVRCPYCGEKSVFSRPKRIELPTGARRVDSRQRQQVSSSKSNRQEESKPSKPDLHLRVSANSATEVNPYNERKLQEAEDQSKLYDQLRNAESRRKKVQKIVGAFVLLGIVILAVIACLVYGSCRGDSNIAPKEHSGSGDSEVTEIAQQNCEANDPIEEKDEDAVVLANEKNAIESQPEKVEPESDDDEDKLFDDENQSQKVSPNRPSEIQRRSARELYYGALSMMEDGKFDFISALPQDCQLDKTTGKYYYLLPFSEKGNLMVAVSIVSNGVASVSWVNAKGEEMPEDAPAFFEKLKERNYLVAFDNRVYFRSKREKAHVDQMSKVKNVDIADEFFGELAPEVKAAKLDFDDLSFEIVFVPHEKDRKQNKAIITQTVEFGMRYSNQKIREAVEEAFPIVSDTESKRVIKKRFKRTVRFWDGKHIKRSSDGVTYVPRNKPDIKDLRFWDGYYSGDRYRVYCQKWKQLCIQARNEDAAERRFYDQQNKSQRELSNVSSEDKAKHAKRISDILENGTLFWRAKLKGKRSVK